MRDLGIAHPPGYPLYTMAAHVFGRVATWEPVLRWIAPEGDGYVGYQRPIYNRVTPSSPWHHPWPWAVNLFSAVLAIATLAVVARATSRLTGTPWAGLLAAAILFASPTFRAQAVVANIRMPTALLTALLFALTIRWMAAEERFAPRRLAAIAFVFGLAVGHHLSLAFLGLPVAIVVVAAHPWIVRDARTLAAAKVAFLTALVPLLYLPIRDLAGALFAPGNLSTVRGFVYHALAIGFSGDVLYFGDVPTLIDRMAVVWNILRLQFGWGLLAIAIGAAWLTANRRLGAFLLAAGAAIVAALVIVYRAPQTMEYLLPAYVALAMIAGGAAPAVLEIAGWWGRDARALVAMVVTAVATLAPTRSVAPRDIVPELRAALGCAPPDGTLLASWHFFAPLTYAVRHPEEFHSGLRRTDVHVVYVQPAGAETPGETWRRRLVEVEAADPGKPVVLTNRQREMIDADVPLWPVPGAPFFASGPLACADDPAAIANKVEITPVDVSYGGIVALREVRTQYRPGVPLDLAFRAARPVTEPLTVVVQLVREPDGAVQGQSDHAYSPARWNDPRGLVDRAAIVPFRSWPATGAFGYRIGVYRTTAAGPERLAVDSSGTLSGAGTDREAWQMGAFSLGVGLLDDRADAPGPQVAGIPYGDAMTLARTAVRRDGAEVVVDLDWHADRLAAQSDYTVSVQVHGDGWSAQDDGTPALGAIPTLKWLTGMRIRDRHRVALPADVPAGAPFRVTVGVYDAFSLEPLPVTDAERVRQGQGQAAEVYAGGG